jgi:hypothetical protein
MSKLVPVTILLSEEDAETYAREIANWPLKKVDGGRVVFEVVEFASEWGGGKEPWFVMKLSLVPSEQIDGQVVSNPLERAHHED